LLYSVGSNPIESFFLFEDKVSYYFLGEGDFDKELYAPKPS
jgi:hypothetical protein